MDVDLVLPDDATRPKAPKIAGATAAHRKQGDRGRGVSQHEALVVQSLIKHRVSRSVAQSFSSHWLFAGGRTTWIA